MLSTGKVKTAIVTKSKQMSPADNE